MHRKLKVIVVEDDPTLRAAFCSTLTQDGNIQTVPAADIEEAIQLCHNEPQLALLVDPGLPHLQGVEAVMVLHKTLPGAALVAITGDDRLREPALEAGATDVIIKASPESHGQALIDAVRKAAIQHETELQFAPGWDIIRQIRERLKTSAATKLPLAIFLMVAVGGWRASVLAEARHLRDTNEVRALGATRCDSPSPGS